MGAHVEGRFYKLEHLRLIRCVIERHMTDLRDVAPVSQKTDEWPCLYHPV